MKESLRIPRPLGTTVLAIEYQKLQTDEAKDRLINHIITYYALNGFRYQGQSYTLQEMSELLQTPLPNIMEAISNLGSNMGNLADPTQLHETAKSIITMGLTFSLQDRGLIQSQLETLLTSQGGTYRPFITAEVNKALKLMLESNKNIHESYKAFFTNTTSTTNILNIHQGRQPDKEYLTPDQAFNLITDQERGLPAGPTKPKTPSLPADTQNMPNPHSPSDTQSLAEELYRKHSIGELRDVKEGRTGTEALRALEPADLPKAPDSQGATNSHRAFETRRGETYQDIDSLPDSE